MIISQKPSDCVLVAMANAFSKSYHEVANALGPFYNPMSGVKVADYTSVYAAYKGTPAVTHRITTAAELEGQSGIVRLARSGTQRGHVVLLRDGLMFDADGECYKPKDYLEVYDCFELDTLLQ